MLRSGMDAVKTNTAGIQPKRASARCSSTLEKTMPFAIRQFLIRELGIDVYDWDADDLIF